MASRSDSSFDATRGDADGVMSSSLVARWSGRRPRNDGSLVIKDGPNFIIIAFIFSLKFLVSLSPSISIALHKYPSADLVLDVVDKAVFPTAEI